MYKKLASIAAKLDENGLYTEADIVTGVLRKLALCTQCPSCGKKIIKTTKSGEPVCEDCGEIKGKQPKHKNRFRNTKKAQNENVAIDLHNLTVEDIKNYKQKLSPYSNREPFLQDVDMEYNKSPYLDTQPLKTTDDWWLKPSPPTNQLQEPYFDNENINTNKYNARNNFGDINIDIEPNRWSDMNTKDYDIQDFNVGEYNDNLIGNMDFDNRYNEWVCSFCGTRNDAKADYCSVCSLHRDVSNEIKQEGLSPEDVLSILRSKRLGG